MATELNDTTTEEQMNAEAQAGMKTFTFKFTIDAPKFAARFGVQLPDDSADESLSEGNEDVKDACVCSDVEDADVVYPQKVKATLDQCKAKNPMLCPYHGMKAVSGEIENILRAAGVNGKVTCTVDRAKGGLLSVTASVVAPESDEKKVQDAMENFFNLPGVSKSFDMEADNGEISGMFDMDMLDPNAQAKWGFGQQQAQTQTPAPAPAPAQVQQPTQPQPQQPAAPQKPKRTRSRLRTAKSAAPAAAPEQPAEEAPKEEVREEPQETVSSEPSEVMGFDADSPTLYPGVAPKEPPKWTPPFTATELDALKNVSERIGKTAETIDKHINAGDMSQYLQKPGDQNKPNANLPKRLQKYKNEVDMQALRALAAKDTDGQVKKLVDAAEKINASEANGWMDAIGIKASDLEFDQGKYADPYVKEREAFNAYKPGSEGRKAGLRLADAVEKSKAKDAPKDAAKRCKDAAKDMDDIEDAFKQAESLGLGDDAKKLLAQAYYKANKDFGEAESECKKWDASQFVMKDSIKDTYDSLDPNSAAAKQCKNWKKSEDKWEDQAWREIAHAKGFPLAKKAEYMANYKKNMAAAAKKCTTFTLQTVDWVKKLIDGKTDALHGTKQSYAWISDDVFGTKFGVGRGHHMTTPNIIKDLHIYACTTAYDPKDVDDWVGFGSGGVGLVVNNKNTVKAFFNDNGGSAGTLNSHYRGCNMTYMGDATCTGVSYNPSIVSSEWFTKDLSGLSPKDLWKASGMGTHSSSNETWILGGLGLHQVSGIKVYGASNPFSSNQMKKLAGLGIKVWDRNGHEMK